MVMHISRRSIALYTYEDLRQSSGNYCLLDSEFLHLS